ncbi:MAG TPA: histidine kinase [Lachnospiraceae bacterium]|nr:histidine kinase [Lachnospiraceae bacterium]
MKVKIRVMATVGVLLLAMTMGIVGVLETGDEGALAEAVSASGSSTSVVGGGAAVTNQTDELGYSVDVYDATNGLPTSDANVVLSTKDGFIWVGGYSGLIRHDGTSFERQTSPSGITSVNALYEDTRRYLWIGTNDNGVLAIHKDKSWKYDYTDGLRSSSIRSITEDNNGNIIIGTTEGIYYVDEQMEIHALDEPMINDKYIENLKADAKGTIYGCDSTGAIFMIRDLKVLAYLSVEDLDAGTVRTIFPDPKNEGMLYIGTRAGTVGYGSFDDKFKDVKWIQISGKSRESEEEDYEKPVNVINYASNRIWVIRDDMIGWLDDSNGYHVLENLPMNSSINSMEEDYEGNLWFASVRQGVMKIVANKFSDITDHDDLDDSVVNATCIHNDRIYIGTDDGMQVLSKDYTPIKGDKLAAYLKGTRVRCLMEDDNGGMWISTYTNDLGLVYLSKTGVISSLTVNNGLKSNQIRSTTLGSDGSILAATNGGLAIIRNNKVEKTIGYDEGMGNTVVLTVVESDGKYYLGTDGGGIYIVDGNNITHMGREDGLTSDVILRMKNDEKRGVTWIITSNSIQYMKDGAIKTVEGFPYTNNYDIYFDDGENAWVVASNGFYVVKARDMIEKEKFEYLHYDYTSGLPCMATVNAYSAQDKLGKLYVAGRTGVFTIDINRYFEKTHDIKLTVPYVEADEERYYPDYEGVIRLPSSASAVTIYGFALTYSMQNPRIRYFLDGVDKEANTVFKKDMQPVRYTNISGGEFSYELSVVNTSTGKIQQTTQIKIIKEKSLYEELWFMVLCIILALAVVAVIVRLYIVRKTRAYVKKQERDKLLIREIVESFSKTIDMKDKYTKGHSARVAEYTVMLARELGYDEEKVEQYHNIALLHDIGKIGVPEEVLNKQGKLTDEEFAIIKSHSAQGYNVLKNISIMPDLAIGAGAHHERPDGKGYPNGLKGDEIPRVAQIIAVADTFDAMYSDRPYRKRMNFDKAVSIIQEVSGTQLTPDVVDAFMRIVKKGGFRAPDDDGGGSTEDINNIRKSYDK